MSVKLDDYVKSPLNFTGGKYKIINELINIFPKNMNRFVDLFCGGLNVSVNVHAKSILANDHMRHVVDLLKMFKTYDSKKLLKKINDVITTNKLSQTGKYGYEKYKTNSSRGVAHFNKKKYLALRDLYNRSKEKDVILLYVLIIFSFNNQIRFNSNSEFNLPVNKRDFTNNMQQNLIKFTNKLKTLNIELTNCDYSSLKIKKSDFIYADPPYLVSTATYNENGGWDEQKDKQLLSYLDKIDKRGIKFALSNALENKGKINNFLIDWSNKYKIHELERSYHNSNYNILEKNNKNTKEVVITNY